MERTNKQNYFHAPHCWQIKASDFFTNYFLSKNKYYYPFINIDKKDSFKGCLYDEYPLLTIITGDRGVGKSSYLTFNYNKDKNNKIGYVFYKNEYSACLSSFIKILIFKCEDVLKLKHHNYAYTKNDNKEELNELMEYLFNLMTTLIDKKENINVYIDNADENILSFLLNIQFIILKREKEHYYKHIPFKFYVVFNNEYEIPSVNTFFDVSHRININVFNDEFNKKQLIKAIIKSYNIIVDEVIVDALNSKKCFASPLYFKLIIHRLAHDSYYTNKLNNNDEIINFINNAPEDIPSLVLYLIKEIAKNYDEKFLYRLIMSIAYSFQKIKKEDILKIFNYMKWEFLYSEYDIIHKLLNVLITYNDNDDTYYLYVSDNKNTISYLLNQLIIEKGYLKYLGSFSSYYLNNKNDITAASSALKIAFVRISLLANEKDISEETFSLWMDYLMDVLFKVQDNLTNLSLSQKDISILIANNISFALTNGFDNAIKTFIAFANNISKANNQYARLFKSYFYYINTDHSSYHNIHKIITFFDEVFYLIENTSQFGDYNNDFALWLKIKFSIVKVRYFTIVSPNIAKKELDKLLQLFVKENIVLPSFYKMQIYSTYLIIVNRSKDVNLYKEIFKDDIFSYFNFIDPDNSNYLRKEEMETLYKAKIYALISLALASVYGDSKKHLFVPLIDEACEIFEKHQSDYALTHFNGQTFTALVEIEALATVMYQKDPYMLNCFRYDARYYYPYSYFIFEAEATYYYWQIMMTSIEEEKKILYLKYLSRRHALAVSSSFKEAYHLYITVYAEFLDFIIDDKNINHKYHLDEMLDALIKYYSLSDTDSDFYDNIYVIAQYFENCYAHNEIEKGEQLYNYINNKYKDDIFVIDCLTYLKIYYLNGDNDFVLGNQLLNKINEQENIEKYQKMKTLLSCYEI